MIEYPSQEYLRSIFNYNKETGILTGNESRGNRKAGKPIGNRTTKGYLVVRLNGQNLSVARVIWIMEFGTRPPQIDHINRVRDDNRLCNLRAADQTTNARNKRTQKNNTSGTKGVSFDRQSGMWKARIGTGNGRATVGMFREKSLAISARKEAEKSLGYHD